MVKAVIFDLDDTLVKTYIIKRAHHQSVAKQFYGIDLSDEEVREHWGKPLNELVTQFYRASDTIENMIAANRSTDHLFPKEIHDHALRIVVELLERDIKVGVITPTNKEFALSDLHRLGFPVEQFFTIQGADESPYNKPDPRVFDPTIELLRQDGIEPADMVYVGDSLSDLAAAHGAGLQFIAITTGLHSAEEFEHAGAKQIISRIDELPSCVFGDVSS